MGGGMWCNKGMNGEIVEKLRLAGACRQLVTYACVCACAFERVLGRRHGGEGGEEGREGGKEERVRMPLERVLILGSTWLACIYISRGRWCWQLSL
jgi:hypothetical protein